MIVHIRRNGGEIRGEIEKVIEGEIGGGIKYFIENYSPIKKKKEDLPLCFLDSVSGCQCG